MPADIFGVSLATVSRNIITWTNYLFFLFGLVPIWISRQQIGFSISQNYKLFSPNLRVILDCTEIRCESPTSRTLHSETFSNYKSTTTFKGLVGVCLVQRLSSPSCTQVQCLTKRLQRSLAFWTCLNLEMRSWQTNLNSGVQFLFHKVGT